MTQYRRYGGGGGYQGHGPRPKHSPRSCVCMCVCRFVRPPCARASRSKTTRPIKHTRTMRRRPAFPPNAQQITFGAPVSQGCCFMVYGACTAAVAGRIRRTHYELHGPCVNHVVPTYYYYYYYYKITVSCGAPHPLRTTINRTFSAVCVCMYDDFFPVFVCARGERG